MAGRPRLFDEDIVIASAMDAFWVHGYERTSLDHLEAVTGLSRSSLYGSFGGKLELFRSALDSYAAGPCSKLAEPFRKRQGHEALAGYIGQLAEFVKSPNACKGCLMVNTSLESIEDERVDEQVTSHFRALRADMRRAFDIAMNDKTLESPLTSVEAADCLLAIVRGVLVAAAAGEPRATLARTLRAGAKQMGLAAP